MKKILIAIGIFCILSIVAFFNLPYLLSKNDCKKNAKILVIEGWLSPDLIENLVNNYNIANYDTIIVVGMTKKPIDLAEQNPINLIRNNTLFAFRNGIVKIADTSIIAAVDSINIECSGSKANGISPTLMVFSADSVIAYIEAPSITATFKLYPNLTNRKVSDFYLYYLNDAFLKTEDRNVYISSISINAKKYQIPGSELNFYPDKMVKIDKEIPFRSVADITRCYINYLLKNKIPTYSIEVMPNGRNYTGQMADAVSKWYHKNNCNSIINVVSTDIHSRRTYTSYKKALKEGSEKIGIISIPHSEEIHDWWKTGDTRNYVIDELLSYIYVLFI